MLTLTRCQDHILTENIWFVCSETSYGGDERRCYRRGTTEQVKIEVLSQWKLEAEFCNCKSSVSKYWEVDNVPFSSSAEKNYLQISQYLLNQQSIFKTCPSNGELACTKNGKKSKRVKTPPPAISLKQHWSLTEKDNNKDKTNTMKTILRGWAI